MGIFSGDRKWANDKSWIKRHSLSIALIVVLVIQAIVVIVTGWPQFVSDAQMHGESAKLLPFTIWFIYEMTVSIIADTYGALLLVLFSKWFFEKGSSESKDKEES